MQSDGTSGLLGPRGDVLPAASAPETDEVQPGDLDERQKALVRRIAGYHKLPGCQTLPFAHPIDLNLGLTIRHGDLYVRGLAVELLTFTLPERQAVLAAVDQIAPYPYGDPTMVAPPGRKAWWQ